MDMIVHTKREKHLKFHSKHSQCYYWTITEFNFLGLTVDECLTW